MQINRVACGFCNQDGYVRHHGQQSPDIGVTITVQNRPARSTAMSPQTQAGSDPPGGGGRGDRPGRAFLAVLPSQPLHIANRHRADINRNSHIDQRPVRNMACPGLTQPAGNLRQRGGRADPRARPAASYSLWVAPTKCLSRSLDKNRIQCLQRSFRLFTGRVGHQDQAATATSG